MIHRLPFAHGHFGMPATVFLFSFTLLLLLQPIPVVAQIPKATNLSDLSLEELANLSINMPGSAGVLERYPMTAKCKHTKWLPSADIVSAMWECAGETQPQHDGMVRNKK